MTDPIKEHICPAVSDIVERARRPHPYSGIQCSDCLACADEIERLRAINAELLEALIALRAVAASDPLMQSREFVGLGIQVNNAIAKATNPVKQIEESAS